MPSIVLTLVGPDRPGLVGSISDVVRAHGGNWLESRMSHLAGQFAGVVLIEVPHHDTDEMMEALRQLNSDELKITVQLDDSPTQPPDNARVYRIEVVGNDRPGIVRELTQVLAAHNINVEELITHVTDAPQAGGRIFRADARIYLPPDISAELLQTELELLAPELMIDLEPDAE